MHGKVEFDEKTALEIIQKFALDEKTIKVWKTRGAIPARYFDGFDASAKLSDDDPIYTKIIEILGMREIAALHFRTFEKRPEKWKDLHIKKDRMTEAEKVVFITEISEIRNKLMKCFVNPTEQTLKIVLADKRFHKHIFIDKKLIERFSRTFFLDANEKIVLKNSLIKLHNNLLITTKKDKL